MALIRKRYDKLHAEGISESCGKYIKTKRFTAYVRGWMPSRYDDVFGVIVRRSYWFDETPALDFPPYPGLENEPRQFIKSPSYKGVSLV